MKVLVAIDSSQAPSIVVDEVARRPWPSGTTACVLHIIDWSQLPSDPLLIESVRQSADVLVKAASDKLGRTGLKSNAKVVDGHPRIAVAEYAKKWGADLVLVGSLGAGGLARFLLGSVAQATLRRSPCSVEIVRRPAQGAASRPMKILIGTDGSDCSMVAVRSVAQRPWPPRCQMRVISVVPLPFGETIPPLGETIPPPAAPVYSIPDLFDTLEKQVRDRAEEAVARGRHILTKGGIQAIETELLPVGDPRQVILDQAKNWGADLIVVGSHGYGCTTLKLGRRPPGLPVILEPAT